VTSTPQLVFRHQQQWHLGTQVKWQQWPLAKNTLPQLITQAKTWQKHAPQALIVGAISYDQAALHHGLPHRGGSAPGALLGLVEAQHWHISTSLPASFEPFQAAEHFAPHLSKAAFIAKLDALIAQLGEQQQANLAQAFSAPYSGSTWTAWQTLMAQHSAPHACYLEHPDISLLSASPELLLQANQQQLIAEPIKGSRPRGKTVTEDQDLAEQLLHSEKDLAENRMITALQMEELTPLCVPGSVVVQKDCELRRYSNVQHLVSTVVGTPLPHQHPLEALIACMPGASITGIPKPWAMQAIAELEDEPRGFYCGSFFSLHPTGELTANVLIRTIQAQQQRLLCHGGGGITAGSNSAEEYEESCFKVAPLFSVWH